MVVFRYDKSFEGLLTALFDAYARKSFPDSLLATGEVEPLFVDEIYEVVTDGTKSGRVWRAVEKKTRREVRNMLMYVWLSEEEGADELLFRYMRKVIDSPKDISGAYTDADILAARQIAVKVSKEGEHVRQFIRFQKARDGSYFARVEPKYNVLPLAVGYLRGRFGDQRWLVYDTRRRYGFIYDLNKVEEIDLGEETPLLGDIEDEMLAEDEVLFQQLWRRYHKAIAIKERANPKLQRQHMPRRFWKYLTEKQ